MQNAKDSFYVALRDRLAVVNPARVMTLRAVVRPGIQVEEAEAPAASMPNNVFVLRWTGMTLVQEVAAVLRSMQCEVLYATGGSQGMSGLDRGRAMAAMDRELRLMLEPLYTPKVSYVTTPAKPLDTNVFWVKPSMGPLETKRDQLMRTVTVTVFAFDEAGE